MSETSKSEINVDSIEVWIDARIYEAEDALIGSYGEPEYEEAYTDLLAEIVTPFADRLREVVKEREEWLRLILKADAASDTDRALATLANMARDELGEQNV